MWFVLKLIWKAIIFVLFKLGLFLIALYAVGIDVLDRFVYGGSLDIYGQNLVFYLLGLAVVTAATVWLWWRKRRRKGKGKGK
jgi:LPXTG-motif cell wall-anchored protein